MKLGRVENALADLVLSLADPTGTSAIREELFYGARKRLMRLYSPKDASKTGEGVVIKNASHR